jgi:hypothetical protein
MSNQAGLALIIEGYHDKKSVSPNEQNFPEALVRPSENYVGGHMINPISNRQPS